MRGDEPDRRLIALWLITGLIVSASFAVYFRTGHGKRAQRVLMLAALPMTVAITKMIVSLLVGHDD